MANKEEKSHMWAGDNVGRGGVHKWLYRNFGLPKKCEICKTDDIKKKYEWSSKNHKYKRDRNEFVRMCKGCHRRYDISKGLVKLSKKFLEKIPERYSLNGKKGNKIRWANHSKIERKCIVCKKIFYTCPSRVKYRPVKCCSGICSTSARKNPEEYNKQVNQSNI